MARGVSLGGAYFGVSSFSVSINRNPLIEESFTSSAATKVYGGAYSVSGSFETIYRTASKGPLKAIIDAINDGSVPQTQDIILNDDAGNTMTFGSCCINSAELNISSKEFVRVTYNFIGQTAKQEGSVPTGSTAGEVGIFYSTVLNFGGTPVKATAATLRLEIPVDQDYFVLGSQYIQGFLQAGLATVEGTLTLGSDADVSFVTEAGAGEDIIEPDISHANTIATKAVELNIGSSAGGTLTTITIPVAKCTTADVGAQGRNKFDKTVNYVGEFDGSNNMTIS